MLKILRKKVGSIFNATLLHTSIWFHYYTFIIMKYEANNLNWSTLIELKTIFDVPPNRHPTNNLTQAGNKHHLQLNNDLSFQFIAIIKVHLIDNFIHDWPHIYVWMYSTRQLIHKTWLTKCEGNTTRFEQSAQLSPLSIWRRMYFDEISLIYLKAQLHWASLLSTRIHLRL